MKKVRNSIIPKKSVSNFKFIAHSNLVSIELNAYANWTHCVRIREFTNEFHNGKEAGKIYFQLVTKLLPFIKEKGEGIKQMPHCHLLRNQERQIATKVIERMHHLKLDDETEIWQLSAGQGIRLIAALIFSESENVYPLFLDPHHLIYPDKKHNQSDYSKKACHFSPITDY